MFMHLDLVFSLELGRVKTYVHSNKEISKTLELQFATRMYCAIV
jgi:hypothetical protein